MDEKWTCDIGNGREGHAHKAEGLWWTPLSRGKWEEGKYSPLCSSNLDYLGRRAPSESCWSASSSEGKGKGMKAISWRNAFHKVLIGKSKELSQKGFHLRQEGEVAWFMRWTEETNIFLSWRWGTAWSTDITLPGGRSMMKGESLWCPSQTNPSKQEGKKNNKWR
jgi:hypothetical protein